MIGLLARYNVHDHLKAVQSEFKIDLQVFFVQTVVKWLGHCFRHCHQPITLLLSLPLDGRLAELRSCGSETPLSFSALASWLNLTEVGLDVDFPVSGRPDTRGTSGNAIRWGAGWFGPIRDGGVGWEFDRGAEAEVAERVRILMRLFQKSRAGSTLAVEDSPLPISN